MSNAQMAERVQTASANVQLDLRIAKREIPIMPASIQTTAICIANAANPALELIAHRRIRFVQPVAVQPLASALQSYARAHASINRQRMLHPATQHPSHANPITPMSMAS